LAAHYHQVSVVKLKLGLKAAGQLQVYQVYIEEHLTARPSGARIGWNSPGKKTGLYVK
jgi:hypothetical protein